MNSVGIAEFAVIKKRTNFKTIVAFAKPRIDNRHKKESLEKDR